MTEPLYKNLAQQLTAQINNGTYPIGSYLPKEMDLCQQHSVSRQTVRAAIAILEEQGLVSRRKKAGTRVESTVQQKTYQHSLNTITDLIYLGEKHTRKVLAISDIVVDTELAQKYNLPAGEHYIAIESIRTIEENTNNEIFSYTQLYLPIIYQHVLESIREQPSKLVALLIEEHTHKAISHIDQSIQIATIDVKIKKILNITSSKEESRLSIKRLYYDENEELLLASLSIHKAIDFSYNFSLKR